jgi:hypothetical protein
VTPENSSNMATGFSRLLAAILIIAAVQPAAAQDQLQYDAQQRLYTLTYVDDQGVNRQVVIVPPNHIEPAMSVNMAGSPGGLRYAYTLAKPILMVDIPCPGSEGNVAVESPKSWSGEHRFHGGLQRFTCMFDAYTPEADVQPGDSTTGFVISSSFLPEIGTARIWGVPPEPPTLEGLVDVGPELPCGTSSPSSMTSTGSRQAST